MGNRSTANREAVSRRDRLARPVISPHIRAGQFDKSPMSGIDRRQTSRLPSEETILITSLSQDPNSSPHVQQGARILDRSSYGLRIETARALAPSTLVRLDMADTLQLGEVTWCARVGEFFHVGLQLEQSLQHLGDLRKLVTSLLGQDPARPLNQSEPAKANQD